MRQHRFRPGVFILTAALLLCILSACGGMPPAASMTAPPSTPSPSPAAAVVDAASISRPAVDMLDPSKEFDWLQQVAIPRLETGTPSANLDNFNADIWEAYRGPLEKLEAGEEEAARRLAHRKRRQQVEDQLHHAYGRCIFWLNHAVTKPPPNGELAEAMGNIQKAEEAKKKLDREILAEYEAE